MTAEEKNKKKDGNGSKNDGENGEDGQDDND